MRRLTVANVTIQDLLYEIIQSFKAISVKKINLIIKDNNKKFPIKRSAEITYGLRNFIGNAIKYSNTKVDIVLTISNEELKIHISDDGPGFPEDIINIIGEPYISTKYKKLKSKAGLGLGSFIGKTLLERKKAVIEFMNSKNSGAVVEIIWQNKDII